ncbi:MAG: DUF4329 domain-containing protein [Proteobacteria bacterium]|nr:DUF4329 domain-containing protein [Pseudomonadota bacterium]
MNSVHGACKAASALTIILLVGSQPIKAVESFDNFWVAPATIKANNSGESGPFDVEISWVNKLADRPSQLRYRDSLISTFASTSNGYSTLAFASSYSDEENSAAIGLRIGSLSFYANAGSGESYSHNNTNYSGIDPYAYHGGNLVAYRYIGASVGYTVGKYLQLQAGQTTVTADRLEDRRSSFIDFSNNRMFARYTYVERGNDYVGYGLDAGIKLGRINLAYQELTNRYDVSTRRIRFNWKQNQQNLFWLDLAVHRNGALEAYSDSSVMVSWQRLLGSDNLVSYATDAELDETPQGGGIGRGILIGGAVAAGAIVLSSGSGEQDSAERVAPSQSNSQSATESSPSPDISQSTDANPPGTATIGNPQHDSARARLNSVNPISVRENREYGGYVYQAADSSFATTAPIVGDASSVDLPDPNFAVPNGTTARASYHTHAAFDPEFESEVFSDTDLEGDQLDNIDGYLATPTGAFLYHEVGTGQVNRLGTVNN